MDRSHVFISSELVKAPLVFFFFTVAARRVAPLFFTSLFTLASPDLLSRISGN